MVRVVSYPTEAIHNDDFYTIDDILGDSEEMRNLRKQARTVALGKSTVLIRGESGTGKELLARGIHNLSPRGSGPFVAINCSAIPEELLESELFGYEEGAFTGARRGGKIGKFELAHKGTLFLDEIGDMTLLLQNKLLRVLQEREVERIGGEVPIPVDVRILAATHRDLDDMLKRGEFREDLYYRINVIPLYITPLRERKQDLDNLLQHFVKKYSFQFNRGEIKISEGFRNRLYAYSWPGNVRELQNVIEYAIAVAEENLLEEQHLPTGLKKCDLGARNHNYNLEEIERDTISRCIQEFGTSVKGKEKAAKALGIGIATLYRKLAYYGLK